MVFITIKGGVWQNQEDEVLKAAIMKYGTNQWSRVASLLPRKTAKNCKARWYNWLDPSIKKIAWSRQEEEKLLHLAKIMPTQWQTIAPMIGRTPAQCLEHYELLLDRAQAESGEEVSTARKLKPGEIDTHPEMRPARPDPVDMDEDQKESLNEALARLANTKGKKASRKSRELLLKETRRMALAQKQRELRAAGIVRKKKRKKTDGINYATEIAFERTPAVGFYDVTEERDLADKLAKNSKTFLGKDRTSLDDGYKKNKDDKEEEAERKRHNMYKKMNLPAALKKTSSLNDPEQLRKRSKLNLPAPQVSDNEIHAIAKLGNMAPPAAQGASSTSITDALLSDPQDRMASGRANMQANRTPLERDVIREETENILALAGQQTPLRGGENTPLHATSYGGVTPAQHRAPTPRRLATSSSSTPSIDRALASGASTPILPSSSSGNDHSAAPQHTRKKRKHNNGATSLGLGFDSLPSPVNEYGLVMPALNTQSAPVDVEVVDAEDLLLLKQTQDKATYKAQMKKRTRAVQQNLPRPRKFNAKQFAAIPAEDAAHVLVYSEMAKLLQFDVKKYPIKAKISSKKRKKKKKVVVPRLNKFTEEELFLARNFVNADLKAVDTVLLKNLPENIELPVFFPTTNSFGFPSEATEANIVAALKHEFSLVQKQIALQSQHSSKLVSKLNMLHGGYETRQATLTATANQVQTKIVEAENDLSSFRGLLLTETQAIAQRISQAQLRRTVQQTRNDLAQAVYQQAQAQQHLPS